MPKRFERSEASKAQQREAHRVWYKQNAEAQKQYQKQYREENKGSLRAQRQFRKYGLTEQQCVQMFRDQGEACAICRSTDPGNKKTGWHVDHDHSTNEVRSILCHPCNLMLGNARDNPAILSAAISYLERFKDGGKEEKAS